MNIFNNHKKLYTTAGALFLGLTFFTAIMPALQNQKNTAPLPESKPLSGDALAGKMIYISEGCVACHSQQVRNVDMDKVFGFAILSLFITAILMSSFFAEKKLDDIRSIQDTIAIDILSSGTSLISIA